MAVFSHNKAISHSQKMTVKPWDLLLIEEK